MYGGFAPLTHSLIIIIIFEMIYTAYYVRIYVKICFTDDNSNIFT